MWSLGLLYASFHMLFEGSNPSSLFLGPFPAVLGKYIFPMSMAMILFMVDSIYNLIKKTANYKLDLVIFLILFVLYWLCFLFTLMYREDVCFSERAFWCAWLLLTMMKLFTTYSLSISENVYPSVQQPDNQ